MLQPLIIFNRTRTATSRPVYTLNFCDMDLIWHFLFLLFWRTRQSLWENGKNEPGPRTLCLSVWPALSEAVNPQGPEGSVETFLTIRCLGRREWHSPGCRSSALFSSQLGPVHIIPSLCHSTPVQWQREKTTVKQCRAHQACLLTSQSAKSTLSVRHTGAETIPTETIHSVLSVQATFPEKFVRVKFKKLKMV